jgi:hypothetical protein
MLMRSRLAVWSAVIALLLGCTPFASPVPKGYKGPVAIVKDSVRKISESKAEFFYITHIDGKRVEDSRFRWLMLNPERGLKLRPAAIERNVPALISTFSVVGKAEYTESSLARMNNAVEVEGAITFAPLTYRHYIVRGELGEKYSAIWIEDEETGKKIGEKIEVRTP